MRIHAASRSPAVTHSLEEIILASGHLLATAEEAELLLIDQAHPPAPIDTACPRIFLGTLHETGELVRTPCPPRQLIRLLKHRRVSQPVSLQYQWQLDPATRTLHHPENAALTLTEKEAALLRSLAEAHPEAKTHDRLLADVWGLRDGVDTHTLETHIYRLRSKLASLDPAPCDIVTAEGAYKLAFSQ